MPLLPLAGHETQRARLAAAIHRGTLPQLLLLTGPTGVGKQRLGLWIAQRMFCEGPPGEPCGTCRGCHLVLNLSHPDLHWFYPVLRPKAAEPDKQAEELEETLSDLMEERRKDPLYGPPDGLAGHFVATARLLTRRAALRPVEGRWRVFLLGHAERLVPQEASPEAANALLKLLEEPPPGSVFILTASDLDAVLPTIRSRAIRMRLNPLRPDQVAGFLAAYRPELPPPARDRAVAMAEGAIGRAVTDSERETRAQDAASRFLEAAVQRDPTGWEMALKQTPFAARGDFTETLDAMAATLQQALRNRGGRGLGSVPESRLLGALDRLGEAREMAQGNINPQLILAVLGQDLGRLL